MSVFDSINVAPRLEFFCYWSFFPKIIFLDEEYFDGEKIKQA